METFDIAAHENRIIAKQHITKTCSRLRDRDVHFSRNVCVHKKKKKEIGLFGFERHLRTQKKQQKKQDFVIIM